MTLHEIFHKFPKELPLPALMDGATGTTLMKLGMPKGVCAEKWALEHPEAVREMQEGYVEAGSDVLCSPTFGANAPTLKRHGVEGAYELNRELCARSAFIHEKGRKLAGNMSPTGLFIEPWGETPFETVAGIYAEQARGQRDGGADIFYTETNISLSEARAAITGIRRATDKPIFATVTIGENGRTLSGETPLCCFLTLALMGACAVGTNCSTGPDAMREFLKPLVPYSVALGVPLIAKPNAGVPKTGADDRIGIGDFCREMRDVLAEGIAVVGGCCGTDAGYIRALREVVGEYGGFPDIKPADVTNLACSGSEVCQIEPSRAAEKALRPTDGAFEDELYDGEDPWLAARLESPEDASALASMITATKKPLALTGDKAVIASFAASYCGTPFVF